ncbi:hypothetical protein CLF_112582, partial [Clonorchis sinensis]
NSVMRLTRFCPNVETDCTLLTLANFSWVIVTGNVLTKIQPAALTMPVATAVRFHLFARDIKELKRTKDRNADNLWDAASDTLNCLLPSHNVLLVPCLQCGQMTIHTLKTGTGNEFRCIVLDTDRKIEIWWGDRQSTSVPLSVLIMSRFFFRFGSIVLLQRGIYNKHKRGHSDRSTFIAFSSTALYTDIFHSDDLNWPLSGIEEERRQTDRQNIDAEVGEDDAPKDEDASDIVHKNESQEVSDGVDQSDAEEEIEEKEYHDGSDDKYYSHSEESHAEDGWVNTDSKIDDDNDEEEAIHTDFHGLDENSKDSKEEEDESGLTEKSHEDRKVDEIENLKDRTGVSEDTREDCNFFEKDEYAVVVTGDDHIPGHEKYEDIEDGGTVVDHFTSNDSELQEDEQHNHTHEEQQEKDSYINDGHDIYMDDHTKRLHNSPVVTWKFGFSVHYAGKHGHVHARDVIDTKAEVIRRVRVIYACRRRRVNNLHYSRKYHGTSYLHTLNVYWGFHAARFLHAVYQNGATFENIYFISACKAVPSTVLSPLRVYTVHTQGDVLVGAAHRRNSIIQPTMKASIVLIVFDKYGICKRSLGVSRLALQQPKELIDHPCLVFTGVSFVTRMCFILLVITWSVTAFSCIAYSLTSKKIAYVGSSWKPLTARTTLLCLTERGLRHKDHSGEVHVVNVIIVVLNPRLLRHMLRLPTKILLVERLVIRHWCYCQLPVTGDIKVNVSSTFWGNIRKHPSREGILSAQMRTEIEEPLEQPISILVAIRSSHNNVVPSSNVIPICRIDGGDSTESLVYDILQSECVAQRPARVSRRARLVVDRRRVFSNLISLFKRRKADLREDALLTCLISSIHRYTCR